MYGNVGSGLPFFFLTRDRMIPRNIFTFWKGPKDELVTRCLKRMVDAHRPEWTVHILDDFAEADSIDGFDNLSVQHQADWLRICLIAKYGGVWLDASSICVRRVNEWVDTISDGRVVGFEAPHSNQVLENWAFAAPKGHPLIVAWKDEFARAIRMGFGAYKQYHIQHIGAHPIQDNMPYLTQHGAYARVHDSRQGHMYSSCCPRIGPLSYLCPHSKWMRWIGDARLMLSSHDPALIKIVKPDRIILNCLSYVLPSWPGGTIHEILGYPIVGQNLLLTLIVLLILVCAYARCARLTLT